MIHRRKFVGLAAASTTVAWSPTLALPQNPASTIGFGFSLYGMKSLKPVDALRHCADVGYDCVELPAMPDWPGAPSAFGAEDRKRFRDGLVEYNIRLSALMENIVLLAEPAIHDKNLVRLREAAELGQELNPTAPTIIETVMGGKPAEWLEVRNRMVDRLGDWARVGDQTNSIIAIKAHISGAAHLPEHLRWLLDQVKSPSLKAAFDYSHFQLRGLDLKDSWEKLASETVFIHVKDSQGDQQKFQFVLPGEGSIDYVSYLKTIRESHYKGDVVVEVSGQIHSRPGYDPLAACKKSYAIDSQFRQANVTRR